MKLLKYAGLSASVVVMALSFMTIFTPSKAAAAPTGCVATRQYYGKDNTCVYYIQRMLNGIGSWHRYEGYHWLRTDGEFGPLTRGQVLAFQDYKWGLEVDGIVGQQTWTALCHEAWSMSVMRPDLPLMPSTYRAGVDAGCRSIFSYY